MMSAEVPIRPASTVVVLRDTPAGPEVFLVRRNFTIAFMAGANVFPGGRVDAADADCDPAWCDLPDEGSPAREAPSLSYRIAALRELFEEAGVLLARNRDGELVAIDDDEVRARFDRYRDEIHAGNATLRAVVEKEDLRLALDGIVPFARWLTPPIEVRRFDTWFFLARVPPRQRPVHDPHESVDSEWLSAAAALARARSGAMHLPPPTWATLRELERFGSSEAAMAWAATRSVQCREPLVVEAHGVREILLPGDPRHPQHEAVPFETRFVWAGDRWLPHAFLR
jgi:8-oxo-dGTP pyrophosphatase MutT (NUDIX family)